ncbi:hypothetical protein ZWY2020_023916 [Hordeum vulgare]|uniref:Response regulatory domain-containing protein n=2 Tax=Hordeum vulgare subsp. vulgare TaxID=112509 RepID=A0A8I6Y6V0_HORVV|nr:hypothetical protein ZWY2020_023916 [Hordeum vulgare]
MLPSHAIRWSMDAGTLNGCPDAEELTPGVLNKGASSGILFCFAVATGSPDLASISFILLCCCWPMSMSTTVQEPPHVLAVDDSLVDRVVISRLLRSSKYRVTTVDSGKKALEVLSLGHQSVQLIITDYCMPEMTGYDLLKRVKESAELRGIPVVIMSSENSPARIRRCLDEGAEEFLIKPVRPSDVSRLCTRVAAAMPMR